MADGVRFQSSCLVMKMAMHFIQEGVVMALDMSRHGMINLELFPQEALLGIDEELVITNVLHQSIKAFYNHCLSHYK